MLQITLPCPVYMPMIHTVSVQEEENFIHIHNRKCKKKTRKIKTTCTVIAKQDTVVLQVLMCSWHLWPQSRVSLSVFATVERNPSPEVERERESMLLEL